MRQFSHLSCVFGILFCGNALLPGTLAAQASVTVAQHIDIAPVWSGHPVGFSLLTHGKRQFAAFYDDQRRMTVAARSLGSTEWQFVRLPERVGWDSHNYITMTVDDDKHIHLSGNMHCVPLVYFRTTRPLDITSFERVTSMVGSREKRCTYPRFFRGASDELIFTYRDGGSGNGDQIYNVYAHKTRTWKRLLDKPLTSGEGKMNAYLHGPVRGPDGVFHLCWVWRDTHDCATNHDLSYARSSDLRHWETSQGTPLALPITLATAEIVAAVPPGGGMINGNTKIGFDSQSRPVIAYHKFDAQGRTQLYNARLEKDGWKSYRTSDWTYRWEFRGGGSIDFDVRLGPVRAGADGRLTQSYNHAKHGSGVWVLDEATLTPVGKAPRRSTMPAEFRRPESKRPGMKVRRAEDLGTSGEPGVRYILRWETFDRNRDRPRKGPLPPPSMLQLYRLNESAASQSK